MTPLAGWSARPADPMTDPDFLRATEARRQRRTPVAPSRKSRPPAEYVNNLSDFHVP
jgi:hypothetical protein